MTAVWHALYQTFIILKDHLYFSQITDQVELLIIQKWPLFALRNTTFKPWLPINVCCRKGMTAIQKDLMLIAISELIWFILTPWRAGKAPVCCQHDMWASSSRSCHCLKLLTTCYATYRNVYWDASPAHTPVPPFLEEHLLPLIIMIILYI